MKDKSLLFVILFAVFFFTFGLIMIFMVTIFNGATEPNVDYFSLFLSIFAFIIMFTIIFSNLFPYKLEIQDNTARITKRSIIPPFKNKIEIIPNIKQAVINKFMIYYIVLLEDSDGKKHNIYPFPSFKRSCISLQKEINQAIANRSVLNIRISEKGDIIKNDLFSTVITLLFCILIAYFSLTNKFYIAFDIFFNMILVILLMNIIINKSKANKKQVQTQTNNTNNKNNYKDINNSIIK